PGGKLARIQTRVDEQFKPGVVVTVGGHDHPVCAVHGSRPGHMRHVQAHLHVFPDVGAFPGLPVQDFNGPVVRDVPEILNVQDNGSGNRLPAFERVQLEGNADGHAEPAGKVVDGQTFTVSGTGIDFQVIAYVGRGKKLVG